MDVRTRVSKPAALVTPCRGSCVAAGKPGKQCHRVRMDGDRSYVGGQGGDGVNWNCCERAVKTKLQRLTAG